jgi:hypothetical protein
MTMDKQILEILVKSKVKTLAQKVTVIKQRNVEEESAEYQLRQARFRTLNVRTLIVRATATELALHERGQPDNVDLAKY